MQSLKVWKLYIEQEGHRWAITFEWGHRLQDAKLLENCHEEYDDHADGEQLHALDPHDSTTGRSPLGDNQATPTPGRDGRKHGLMWVAALLNNKWFQQGGVRKQQEPVRLAGDCGKSLRGPGRSMRSRWTKAALESTLMLKWKICGGWHIWKASLFGLMRKTAASHSLARVEGDF